MKYRKIAGCLAFFLSLAAKVNSQQRLPAGSAAFFQSTSLFEQFPPSSGCEDSSLKALFDATNQISLQLDKSHSFRGNIISHIKPNRFAETINIRLLDFPHAMLTMSCIRQENGITTYSGHLLSFGSKDAIVLCRKNQKYYFIKTDQRLVLTE